MEIDIKNEILLLNFYIKYSIRLYEIARKKGELKNINDEIFFDIEIYTDSIMGYACDAKRGSFKRKDEALSYLGSKSIYNLPNVVLWMQEEKSIKEYPNYYRYILMAENIRILALKLFKKSKELDIIKVDIEDIKQ